MTSPSRRLSVAGTALVALVAPLLLATPAYASVTANEIVYTTDDNNDGVANDADTDGLYSVVLRDLATKRVTTVLPADATNEWIYDEPELSPDGGRVALSTDRGGGAERAEGIVVVNRDGTGFRRLTTPPITQTETTATYSLDVSPAWSPDGARILFTRITVTTPIDANGDAAGEDSVDTTLFTVASAGGTAAALPGAEDGATGDWNPDGSKVVFAAIANATTDDSGPLMLVNADGSGGRTALGSGVVGYSPTWSPDGSTIAYATITSLDSDRQRAHDVAQIATVPAAGGTAKVLAATRPTTARTVAEYPTWMPDGESIVYDLFPYTEADFPPGDLWAVDKDGVRAGKIAVTTGDDTQPHVHGPRPSTVTQGTESTYVPVDPGRILNTIAGVGAPKAKLGPAGTLDLDVTGVLPTTEPDRTITVPDNATAVVLNVTVTSVTAGTDIRIYPSGTPVPSASNLNAGAGQTVPNLVTVAVGGNGGVTLRNAGGSVNLLADLAGYYVPGTGGVGFAPLEPGRILDTRNGTGAPQAKVGPAGTLDLDVIGALPTADGGTVTVPDGATAVVLNVTGTAATAGTDIRVYPKPTDTRFPGVSNLNLRPGLTAANLVTVKVGEGGMVRLRNAGGTVHLIADIAGYYSPSAPGRFVPVTPVRFLDTRTGIGGAPIPVTAKGYVDLKVAGARGVPAGATAAVLNLTGTGVSAGTNVRAFPAGTTTVPTISNLNLAKGATRANLTIVKIGVDGRIRVFNASGQLQLIGDLAGYMVG